MLQPVFAVIGAYAAPLFASVLLIVVLFLIARLAKASQPLALALALSPMAVVLAFSGAILPAVGLG